MSVSPVWNLRLKPVATRSEHSGTCKPHYPELDGLRAIGVAMILCFHFGPGLAPKGLLPFCQTGVDVFFVLSGFLITGILLRSSANRWDEIGRFYFRRSVRIFPLYYLFLVLWVLFSKQPLSGWYWVYLENVRYLGRIPPGPNHFWSLAVEEQFYLAWPFLVLFWPRRWLARTMWALLAVSVVLQIVLTGSVVQCFYFTPTRIEALVAGGLIAYYLADGTLGGARPFLVWLGAVCLLLQPIERLLSHGTGLAAVEMMRPSTTAGLYVSVLAILIGGRKTVIHCLFAARPLVAVGRVSYGMYVYHRAIFGMLRGPLSFLPPVVAELVCFGAVYAVSCLSYLGFEKRFLRLTVDRRERRGAGLWPSRIVTGWRIVPAILPQMDETPAERGHPIRPG